MPMKLEILYFPMAGRAEPTRLALTLGGVEFEDKRVAGEEWGKLKAGTPFGQMPVLTVDGVAMTQSNAMLRFAGKVAKVDGEALYPEDPVAAFKADEVLDAFNDAWATMMPTFAMQDEAERVKARKELVQPGGKFYQIVESLEKKVAGYGTPFVSGEKMGIADVALFCNLSTLRSGMLDGVDKDAFDKLATMQAIRKKVASHPKVEAYYKGRDNYAAFQP